MGRGKKKKGKSNQCSVLVGSSEHVESRASAEPLDLGLVEGVVEDNVELSSAGSRLDMKSDMRALLEVLEAAERDAVVARDAIVVSGVGEGKSKDTLLLEVALVDTGEAAGDDGDTAKMTRLKSSVLARAALTVVAVTDNDPLEASSLVGTGSCSNRAELASDLVLDAILLLVGVVDGSQEEVVADVVKMATEAEPLASLGDVVGSALAADLDEDGCILDVLAVPSGEGLERSKTLRALLEGNNNVLAVLGRSKIHILALGVLVALRKRTANRSLKKVLGAVRSLELVLARIESKAAAESKSSHDRRAADEGVGLLVAISTGNEVAVVGVEDGVLEAAGGVNVLTLPLTDARTASIGKDNTTDAAEDVGNAVALDGRTDLLRARRDVELGLDLGSVLGSLAADVGSAAEILVAAVGAGADEAHKELVDPSALLEVSSHVRKLSGTVRRGRTVDVRSKLREVQLDDLVVDAVLIGTEESVLVLEGKVCDGAAASRAEELVLTLVVREDAAGGTDLCTHVADSRLASAGDLLDTRTVVLDDAARTTRNSELAAHPKDDVLGAHPRVHLASDVDTDDLGSLELKRKTSHNIDSIRTTDTDSDHTHTTSIGSVGVSADHHATREGIVLKDKLVDNTTARSPEAHVVLLCGSTEEVVHLLVGLAGSSKILVATLVLSSDKVISMHSGRNSNTRDARRHELENSHLGSGILHGNTVRVQIKIALLLLDLLGGILQMAVEDLLGIGHGLRPLLAELSKTPEHLVVVDVRLGVVVAHRNLGHLRD